MKKTDIYKKELKESTLFTAKENYFLTHASNGEYYYCTKLSKEELKKRSYNNLDIISEVHTSLEIRFPQVQPYNGTTEFDLRSFKERNRPSSGKFAIHFFMNDYEFANLWTRLKQYTYKLLHYDILVAPDYSLYVDVPQTINMGNVYKSRLVTAYWQQNGQSVIPTASWGGADSFSYCFEGLPKHSVIAVCGIGHSHCKSANILWHEAMHNLENEKEPTKIIVYGGPKPIQSEFKTEIVYYEDHITKHFRKKID